MNTVEKQQRIFGTKIGFHDVVSGALFHKFVHEIRIYDRKQKKLLMQQQNAIEAQRSEIERLREEIGRYTKIFNSIIVNCRSSDIVARQRAQIVQLLNQNAKLKTQLNNS